MPKTLFILLSHTITQEQKEDATKRFDVERFETVPAKEWSSIPPEADEISPYIEDAKRFLQEEAKSGDLLWVQGEYGATFAMVEFAKSLGLQAIYATTKRVVTEKIVDGKSVKTTIFSHVRFREYA